MKRTHGFTLLEVMIAFVLLAAAMSLLVSMISRGLRQVQQAQGETEATLYAQSLMDQIGVLEPITAGRSEGNFDHGRYRYQLQIDEAADPSPRPVAGPAPPMGSISSVDAPRLYSIVLAVSWGANLPAQRLHFSTLRARTPLLTGLPAQ